MRDAVQNGVDGVAQRAGVLQEQPFEMLADCAQAVAEVGLQGWLASFAAEVLLGVVGEQPRHGDQAASCPQLLAHRALALHVEGLQPHRDDVPPQRREALFPPGLLRPVRSSSRKSSRSGQAQTALGVAAGRAPWSQTPAHRFISVHWSFVPAAQLHVPP